MPSALVLLDHFFFTWFHIDAAVHEVNDLFAKPLFCANPDPEKQPHFLEQLQDFWVESLCSGNALKLNMRIFCFYDFLMKKP
jgi:hypothetical protein